MSPRTYVTASASAALAAVAALLGVWWAGGASGPTLQIAGGIPAGQTVLEGVGSVKPGAPQSPGSMTVCLSGPGRATITSVRPWKPVGRVIVQAFAVRPSPFMQDPPGMGLGDDTGPLSKFGFTGSHVVDIACNSRAGAAYELAIQVTKPTGRQVGAAGWVISYVSGGRRSQLTFPLAVKLCSGRADAPTCRRLDHYFLAAG